MINAIESSLLGMQVNRQDLERHAQNISRWGTADDGAEEIRLEEELVGVLRARRGWEANATVLKVADDMLGTLIDILA